MVAVRRLFGRHSSSAVPTGAAASPHLLPSGRRVLRTGCRPKTPAQRAQRGARRRVDERLDFALSCGSCSTFPALGRRRYCRRCRCCCRQRGGHGRAGHASDCADLQQRLQPAAEGEGRGLLQGSHGVQGGGAAGRGRCQMTVIGLWGGVSLSGDEGIKGSLKLHTSQFAEHEQAPRSTCI